MAETRTSTPALFLACSIGVDAVKAQLQAGANINQIHAGQTALAYCLNKYSEEKENAKYQDVALLLIKQQADVTHDSVANAVKSMRNLTKDMGEVVWIIENIRYIQKKNQSSMLKGIHSYAVAESYHKLRLRQETFNWVYTAALYGNGDGMAECSTLPGGFFSGGSRWARAIFWLEKSCYTTTTKKNNSLSGSINWLNSNMKVLLGTKDQKFIFAFYMALARIHIFCNEHQLALDYFLKAKALFTSKKELLHADTLIQLHKLVARMIIASSPSGDPVTEKQVIERYSFAARLGDIDSALIVAEFFRRNSIRQDIQNADHFMKEYCVLAMENAFMTRDRDLITETRKRIQIFRDECEGRPLFFAIGIFAETEGGMYEAEYKAELHQSLDVQIDLAFEQIEPELHRLVQAKNAKFVTELKAMTNMSDKTAVINKFIAQLKNAVQHKDAEATQQVETELQNYLQSIAERQSLSSVLPENHFLFADSDKSLIESRSRILCSLIERLGKHQPASYQVNVNEIYIFDLFAKAQRTKLIIFPDKFDNTSIDLMHSKALIQTMFYPNCDPGLNKIIRFTLGKEAKLSNPERAALHAKIYKYLQCENAVSSEESPFLKQQMQANFIPALYFYDQHLALTTNKSGLPHVTSRLLLCTKLLCLTHHVAVTAEELSIPVSQIEKIRKHAQDFLNKCKKQTDDIYRDTSPEHKMKSSKFATWCDELQKKIKTERTAFNAENDIDACILNAPEITLYDDLERKELIVGRLQQAYKNLDMSKMYNEKIPRMPKKPNVLSALFSKKTQREEKKRSLPAPAPLPMPAVSSVPAASPSPVPASAAVKPAHSQPYPSAYPRLSFASAPASSVELSAPIVSAQSAQYERKA